MEQDWGFPEREMMWMEVLVVRKRKMECLVVEEWGMCEVRVKLVEGMNVEEIEMERVEWVEWMVLGMLLVHI